MMHRLAFAIAVVLGGTFAVPAAAQQAAQAPAAQQQNPEQIVQDIARQLDVQVGNNKAELQRDREKLIGIINGVFRPHFDVDYAAILVLGQHARTATPEQRQQFAKAFYNSITHRYAEGLLKYTSGAVKVLPYAGDLNTKRTVVRTQVATGDGKTVSVDFAFRKTASGEWKAYDVVIEGISYITNYRNQVDAEIRKVGLDQLIKNLQTQGDQALKSMEQDSKAHGG